MWPTINQYLSIRDAVNDIWPNDIIWSENVSEPETAESFALEACFVIQNSGMKAKIASNIWFNQVRPALESGGSAHDGFGHEGKANAMDFIWRERDCLFSEYQKSQDKLAFIESLPWIGEITKYHLAKNLGVDCAKPDRWLVRLAEVSGESVDGLCARVAKESGDRVATVDYVLWRACSAEWIDVVSGEIVPGRHSSKVLIDELFLSKINKGLVIK